MPVSQRLDEEKQIRDSQTLRSYPFWSEHYGPLVGTQSVPLMRDLLQEQWTWAIWWLLNLSLSVMIGAALTQQVIVLQGAGGVSSRSWASFMIQKRQRLSEK